MDGTHRWVNAHGEAVRDLSGLIVGLRGTVQDITERKQIEEALRESEEKYRAFFENIIDAILLTSPDGTIYAANPEASLIFGMTEEEIIRAGRNRITDTSDPGLQLALEARARTGKFKGEFNLRRNDGTIFPSEVSTALFTDRNGLAKTSMIIRDITERKQAEEALRESEERLRLLGDNLPDSAVYQYAHEPDGSVRFLYFSEGIERLNGVSTQDVLRDSGTLHRQIPPEYFERLVEAEARSALELSDFDMETPMRLPGGHVRWMRVHSRPRRLPDGRTIWDGVQIDITERKQAEELLAYQANLLANISDVVYSTDDQLRLVSWNQAAEKVYGWKKEEALGKNVIEMTGSMFNPEMRAKLTVELQEKGSVSAEIEHTTISGEHIIFDSNTMPLWDAGGKIVGYVAVNRNITERKRAEKVLRYHAHLVDNVSDAIISTDKELKIRSWNKAAERMYGWQADEIIGLKGSDILQTTFPEGLSREAIAKDIFEKGGWEGELIQRTKDGRDITVHARSMALKDEAGGVIGGVSISSDITERKRAEEALRESEDRYHMLFEHMSEGFFLAEIICDQLGKPVDYRHLVVNPALERVTGMKREDLVGKTRLEALVTPSPWIDIFGKVALSGQPETFEDFSAPLNRHYSIAVYSPRPGQFACLVQDITERKKAEAEIQKLVALVQQEKDRLLTLVNSIPDEVWFADTQKKISLVNPAVLNEFDSRTFDNADVEAIAGSSEVYRPDGALRVL